MGSQIGEFSKGSLSVIDTPSQKKKNNNNTIAPRECNWILGGEKKFYVLQRFMVFQRASAYKQIYSISVVSTIHREYMWKHV